MTLLQCYEDVSSSDIILFVQFANLTNFKSFVWCLIMVGKHYVMNTILYPPSFEERQSWGKSFNFSLEVIATLVKIKEGKRKLKYLIRDCPLIIQSLKTPSFYSLLTFCHWLIFYLWKTHFPKSYEQRMGSWSSDCRWVPRRKEPELSKLALDITSWAFSYEPDNPRYIATVRYF